MSKSSKTYALMCNSYALTATTAASMYLPDPRPAHLPDRNVVGKQSQQHGFTWENSIRQIVFNLPLQKNDTNIHDIPKELNLYNKHENISIKTTGSLRIDCGDILRIMNYNNTVNNMDINTIIIIFYYQTPTHKIIRQIWEMNFNKDLHDYLFGNLPKEVIENYVKGVKSIPTNVKGIEAKNIFNYLDEKAKLQQTYTHKILISPKVDSNQSRVQCSINLNDPNLKDYITYKSPQDKPNLLRNKEIISKIQSGRRSRGGITVSKLKQLCKENSITKYSHLNKNDLITLLRYHNIKFSD